MNILGVSNPADNLSVIRQGGGVLEVILCVTIVFQLRGTTVCSCAIIVAISGSTACTVENTVTKFTRNGFKRRTSCSFKVSYNCGDLHTLSFVISELNTTGTARTFLLDSLSVQPSETKNCRKPFRKYVYPVQGEECLWFAQDLKMPMIEVAIQDITKRKNKAVT